MPKQDEDEECIHGLGPVSACVICNGTMAREKREQWRVTASFNAKFDSECAKCDGAIHEGDRAYYAVNGKVICYRCGWGNNAEG